jgi:hypothetical protein
MSLATSIQGRTPTTIDRANKETIFFGKRLGHNDLRRFLSLLQMRHMATLLNPVQL